MIKDTISKADSDRILNYVNKACSIIFKFEDKHGDNNTKIDVNAAKDIQNLLSTIEYVVNNSIDL